MTKPTGCTRRRAPAMLLATAACLLAGIAPAQAANERIIAIFNSLSEPFFVFMQRAALDIARQEGLRLSIIDGQSSSAKQTADISNAIVQGADGIILAPADVKALVPAVNEAIDAKVPLVTVDRRVEGASRPVPIVGADNVAGGRIQATWVIENFPQGARMVVLSGTPGSSSGNDRLKGVREAFAAAGPTYRIVAEQTANWRRAEGLTVTEAVLTTLGRELPDVILAANDDMALGASEAVRSMRVEDKGIKVLGFDATPDALRAVREGRLVATMEQSPRDQIGGAIRTLLAHLRRGEAMASATITPVLITKDNLSRAERFSELQ